MRRSSLAFLISLFCAAPAYAVPGPDSTAVVANSNDPQSVALAELYVRARAIPRRQLCLLDLPADHTISLADFNTRFDAPFTECIASIRDRIEAVVLARGVPLRVSIPTAGGERVSFAAAVIVAQSTTSSTGQRLLSSAPGAVISCGGTPCYAARWQNPFRSGLFEPGWQRTSNGIDYRPLLVTMLHGRSAADAARLIASATTAEALSGASGTFLFMDGADRARGALDFTYDTVMRELGALGFSDVERVPFDADLQGRSLASLFVGTARLGRTIEGNTYAPGAIVDNLTSFGALPVNFEAPEQEAQVSIARWVARGVAGVHGTTDEPLNNCFPARALLTDYAAGGTLGEAFHRNLPFTFWRNLVLGDVMAAPYAVRPVVRLNGVSPGERVEGARMISVEVEDPLGRPIDRVVFYVDGLEVARESGPTLELCATLPAGNVQLLAVAQVALDGTQASKHRPKGWASVQVEATAGRIDCSEAPDAGVMDSGQAVDAGASDSGALADAADPTSAEEVGCACSTAGGSSASAWPTVGALLFFCVRRLRRRAATTAS